MITALPTVTVSAIFLAWKACDRDRQRRDEQRRERRLRERVAYMLWVAAHDGDGGRDDEDDGDPPPANDLERRLTTYSILDRR
jgi:hypothetical protein